MKPEDAGDEPDTRTPEERRRDGQKMRDESPHFQRMKPGDPGWLPPGATEITLIAPRWADDEDETEETGPLGTTEE